jgi:hypothetical protein
MLAVESSRAFYLSCYIGMLHDFQLQGDAREARILYPLLQCQISVATLKGGGARG